MHQANGIRIFISSPGDVAPERQRTIKVIEKVQTGLEERIKLTPISWEETYYTAETGFQPQIPPPSQTDLVLCILWKRLGSELPSQYDRPDGSHRTGTEWEFEDALQSAVKREVPDILVYRKTAPVTFAAERVDAEQADFHHLEDFWKKWFHNEQGHFTAGFQYFQDTDEFEVLFEKHLRQWLADRSEDVIWPVPIKGSPFRGLEPYDEEHAPVFYGRRRAVEEAKARLVTCALGGCAFLLVTGMSGSGKSSLVRAGLGPRLQRLGAAPGVDRWRRTVMRPASHPGGPLLSLAEALFQEGALPELAEGDCAVAAELAACMAESASQAVRSVGRALDRVASAIRAAEGFERDVDVHLLLIVDQLEELLQAPPVERDAFAALLMSFCREGRIWVVATLRSDFYQQLKEIPLIWELKERGGQYPLSPPRPAEIREIIQGPAQAAGLAFEADLENGESLDAILERGASGPGYLPLLQFTLGRLFELREQQKNLLLLSTYKALGGIEGSISAHADIIFEALDAQAREALPRVLSHLVTVRPDNPELLLPRPVPLATFAEGSAELRLIAALVAPEARLLVSDGEGDAVTVRVAHEALLSHWDKAKAFIEAARPALGARARLGQAAAVWAAEGKRADLLWGSAQLLRDTQDLLKRHELGLAPQDREFLDKSLARARRNVRLKRMTVAALVVLTVISVIGFGVSLVQYRRAGGERDRAEKQKQLALEAINRLTFQLPPKLSKIPGTLDIVRETVETNVELLDRILSLEPDTRKAQWQKVSNWLLRGDTWLTLGDTSKAMESYGQGLLIIKRLTDADQEDTYAQGDLSIIYRKIGNTLAATGDTAGALAVYRQSMESAMWMSVADPESPRWQRNLSINHDKLGDMLKATGDTAGAMEQYRQSLAIQERLAVADPKNTEWQRDLSVSYNKIGDLLADMGDTTGALTEYRKLLENSERLVTSDPKNSDWQTDLSVSHDRIGLVLAATGDSVGAMEQYRQSLAIQERLAVADPKNAQWQRNLSVSYNKIGDMLADMGDTTGALTEYRKLLENSERLATSDPKNSDWQTDLSVSHDRIGRVLAATGDSVGAQAEFRQGLEIAKRLAADDTKNTDRQRSLSVSHNMTGDMLATKGDTVGAMSEYRKALEISTQLAAVDPKNNLWQRDLSVSYDRIGRMLAAKGDTAGALAEYRQGLEIATRLAVANPKNTQWQWDLYKNHITIGNMLAATGDTAGALAEFRQSLVIQERLAADDPKNTIQQQYLSVQRVRFGDMLKATGDSVGAMEQYRQSLAIQERLAVADPKNAQWQRDLFISHVKIGSALAATADTVQALAHFQQGLAIMEPLAAKDPQNAQWQKDIANLRRDIARLQPK